MKRKIKAEVKRKVEECREISEEQHERQIQVSAKRKATTLPTIGIETDSKRK